MPGPQPLKNMGSAVADLGLGDQLVQQLQDNEDERKKKQQLQSSTPGVQGLGMLAGGGVMQGAAVRALGLG